MSKKVLVTGGFGRVAGSVVPLLIKSGYQVRVFARTDHEDAAYRKEVEVVIGDLANYENVFRSMKDVDIVCHLGALFPPLFFEESKIIETNVLGTFNVLQAMKETKRPRRIVFASSDAVYATGASHDSYVKPLDEDGPLWPVNVYGVTKVANEATIEKYARIFGFSYTVLRIFWSMRPDEMLRLMFEARNYMDDIVDEDREGLTPETIIELRCEDGTPYYDHITDFRDVARSVFLTLENEDIHNEIINIAAADRVDYAVESARIAKALERPFKAVRVKGIKNYEADISKARRLLTFEPEYTMEKMIDEAIVNEIGKGLMRR